MSTPPESKPFSDPGSPEFLRPQLLGAGLDPTKRFDADNLTTYVGDLVLQSLPNDLTRMIYLASLRDCNSGLYLHPEISQQRGLHEADRAFRMCHERVFHNLLTTRLPEYVQQLGEYVRYTRGENRHHAENLEVAAGLSGHGSGGSASRVGGIILPHPQHRARNPEPGSVGATACLDTGKAFEGKSSGPHTDQLKPHKHQGSCAAQCA